MGKRLKRGKGICSCASPRSVSFSSLRPFTFYEEDLWTEIAKYLDGKSLVMLATTCKWFYKIVMEDSVWKFTCLRDLQVPDPGNIGLKWRQLYASAFDGTHSYLFRQQEKHIDWMRIGAFTISSSLAVLTDKLVCPGKISLEEGYSEKVLQSSGLTLLSNIKNGIWIADLQLVRCPVCDLNTCDGTMQTLDARHIELFLSEGYQDGSWEYTLLGSHETKEHIDGACGAVFDFDSMGDASTAALFDLKSWIGKPDDWQPRTKLTSHAVAVNTNLQENEGIQVKYHVMRAGEEGSVISIRISQQLL